jgi:hypothetical protein
MIGQQVTVQKNYTAKIMSDNKPDENEGDKILVSFYLSPKTLEKIDDLVFYVKKQLPFEKRRKLSKSVFYETGFKVLIEDYNSKGEESLLLKALQELMRD